MIKAGIIGGAGYTAGEAIRILLRHPQCKLVFVQSRSQAGKAVTEIHRDLTGETDLKFNENYQQDVHVIFFCLGHGETQLFLLKNKIDPKIKLIDLSQDFRLTDAKQSGYVYGLPEAFKEEIKKATHIANPGCFATAIQLSLLPFAVNKMLKGEVHISGITGSTGAGQKPTETSHFSWRSSNISTYKVFEHQHLNEIQHTIGRLQGAESNIYFLPFRGNFTRGILSCTYLKSDLTMKQATILFSDYYKDHPFVHLVDKNPDVKQVLNTNKCLLFIEKHKDVINITCVIDNLVKGASGQAVQNMNLMFGLDETAGLMLKPVAF
jgi:N-acetyl-gamma-glutamyl-phosphate reductase